MSLHYWPPPEPTGGWPLPHGTGSAWDAVFAAMIEDEQMHNNGLTREQVECLEQTETEREEKRGHEPITGEMEVIVAELNAKAIQL